ncbi:MAG: cysteine desulfurase family protein [Anaerolineales bacterium]|jgi:cysteine desulfurase
MKVKYSNKIYLDYAATTPIDSRVLGEMLPFFSQDFGNPSSVHLYGQKAEAAVENSRSIMAEVFNCQPEEIVFTSCGTESNNLALRGAAFLAREKKNANHILISPVEHDGVVKTARQLASRFDFNLEFLPVNEFGQVSPEDVEKRIGTNTTIVSIIYGNNEIGTLNPIEEIGKVCREKGVLFHTDAVQAAAHLKINSKDINAALITFGAHKAYGPKGVGALHVREGVKLQPTQTGGGQEHNLRAGTSNVPLIVGQATAFKILSEKRDSYQEKMIAMRDHLIGRVLESIPDVRLTGHPNERLPNHASFVFLGIDGNELLIQLDIEGFACSSGSACKTGNPEPSEVLKAIGVEKEWALGSLRVTLGNQTKDEELLKFIDILPRVVSRLRNTRGN